MNTPSHDYLSLSIFWMAISILLYFLMNGAQLFETFLIVPSWTRNPPESFIMFKRPHGLDFKVFWIVFHSVHEITFILALIFCWKVPDVRNWMLILLAAHIAVRAWTLAYFAPNIIEFQRMANANETSEDLLLRTMQWKNLNLVRVAIFLAVSFAQVPLLKKLIMLRY